MSKYKNNIRDEIHTPDSIDKLIHEPARLNIMTHLYVVESADFLFMMRQTGLTFGNLSAHMSKLEEAGYIDIIKEFVGKKPHTMLKNSSMNFKRLEDERKTNSWCIIGNRDRDSINRCYFNVVWNSSCFLEKYHSYSRDDFNCFI
jgi:DNA-binding transcriptional ArsR family regulator